MASLDISKLKVPHLVQAGPSIPSPQEESLRDKPWEQLSKLLAPKATAIDNSEAKEDKIKEVEQHVGDEQ